ncbi:hypothetical protein AXL65_02260 [Salmonella enterica subsp. enterica]|nr:hypothetical protein [Salmonella enterica subsp. enterica]
MAALITLTDDQRNRLPKLINNLNFGVRNMDIGQLFVDVLDGTNTRLLETRDLWQIQFVMNKLNMGTFHYDFGDLFVDLLEGNKSDITQNHKDDLVRVLNKLNMSLTALQFGELTAEAISPAAPVTVTPPGTTKSVTGKTQAKANGGDSINFTSMFDGVGIGAADFTYKVNPTAAGAVDAQGTLKLNNTASGKVTVVATGAGVTGSPATFTITAVTAVRSISASPKSTAAAGGKVAFASMFQAIGVTPADLTFVVTPAAGSKGGAVDQTTGELTLDADATGDVTVKATAAGVTGSPATYTVTVS